MADIPSVKAVMRLGLTVGDGADPDEQPDTIWCDEGVVRFTPNNTFTKVAQGSPAPWTAGHAVLEVPIDSEGYLTWGGSRYVWLLDLTSDAVNPRIPDGKATHRLEFRGVKAGGILVNFESTTVRIATDTAVNGVCDLTLLTPVPTAGGTPIVRGPAGEQGPKGDPGDGTTPAEVAGFLTDPAPNAFKAELSDAIGGKIAAATETTPATGDALEALAAWLDIGAPGEDFTLAVASDSTANDANDYPRIWLSMLAPKYPDLRIEATGGFTGGAYGYSDVVLQAGTGSAASGGTVMADNFNRTAADLAGSTSSGGQIWAGTAGKWVADGASASASTVPAPLSVNTADKRTTLTAVIDVTTTGLAAAQRLDFVIGAESATLGGSHIYAYLSINASGIPSFGVYKVISGTSTALGTASFATGLPSNSANAKRATVTLAVTAAGEVAATITPDGGSTVTAGGTLAGGDYALLGTHAGLKQSSVTPSPKIDSITITVPVIPGTFKRLRLLNGAVAGTKLEYQQTNLAAMYPTAQKIDALLVAGGHNYATNTPGVFVGAVQAFITAYETAHPESLIVWSSQNPEFVGVGANVSAHRARQLAGRLYARSQGWGYVPAFEAFTRLPDGGASLMGDAIHPSTPAPGTTTPGYGATFWASLIDAIVTRRTLA